MEHQVAQEIERIFIGGSPGPEKLTSIGDENM